MNITIDIPDDISQQLAGIKNSNVFVLNAIKKALEAQSQTSTEDSRLKIQNNDDLQHSELITNSVKKHKNLLLKLAK